MINFIIFIFSIIFLYILSRIFIQRLFIFLYRFTRSREKAALFLGLIFLPGTFIHEIAHFITALFLLVPVGDLNLIPEIQEDGIKLGSVGVGRTDFIRGSLIGLAPILVGGGIFFAAISFTLSHNNLSNPWIVGTLIYLIFQITHTMFSSRRDLYAVLELGVFVVVVTIALISLKIFGPFSYLYEQIQTSGPFFLKLSYFLFIPISFELVFLTFFRKTRV